MCVAQTAKRRRSQAKHDNRYNGRLVKDASKSKNKMLEQIQREQARAQRKAGKK